MVAADGSRMKPMRGWMDGWMGIACFEQDWIEGSKSYHKALSSLICCLQTNACGAQCCRCRPSWVTGRPRYLLESAGDGGFIVSGLMQSDGDGERSRFVVTWLSPDRDRPAQWPRLSDRWLVRLVELPR